jgi:hypothetical protein
LYNQNRELNSITDWFGDVEKLREEHDHWRESGGEEGGKIHQDLVSRTWNMVDKMPKGHTGGLPGKLGELLGIGVQTVHEIRYPRG